MKDYSLNQEEQNNFVLNYEKDDNEMIVNFANGDSYRIPNTCGNEHKVLNKMRDQVEGAKEFKKKTEGRIETLCFACIVTTSIIVTIIYIANGKLFNLPMPILTGMGTIAILSTPFFVKMIKNKKILKDIEKNELYVKNEQDIIRGLSNQNVLENIHSLHNVSLEEVNINTIDDLNKENLEEVLSCVKHEDEFAFDTFDIEQEPIESKPKTRKRTR